MFKSPSFLTKKKKQTKKKKLLQPQKYELLKGGINQLKKNKMAYIVRKEKCFLSKHLI